MKSISLFLLQIACCLMASCQSANESPQQPASNPVAPAPESPSPEASEDLTCEMKALLAAYPQLIKTVRDNQVIFQDGSSLPWDDGKLNKSFEQLVNEPDIEAQFHFRYPTNELPNKIPKNEDPGRIRNEDFFKKMYGTSAENVRNHLVDVLWCPKTIGQTIRVTQVNRVDSIIRLISAELDEMPEFKKFVSNIGGTFNWRLISGTSRLSMHSFGMTIDINTSCSHYWQWDCSCKAEDVNLGYKNQIPEAIVRVFEKHRFIWGGRWYHYDTMHFEYRPELFDVCEGK
mgnify:CR=1 FL=1